MRTSPSMERMSLVPDLERAIFNTFPSSAIVNANRCHRDIGSHGPIIRPACKHMFVSIGQHNHPVTSDWQRRDKAYGTHPQVDVYARVHTLSVISTEHCRLDVDLVIHPLTQTTQCAGCGISRRQGGIWERRLTLLK